MKFEPKNHFKDFESTKNHTEQITTIMSHSEIPLQLSLMIDKLLRGSGYLVTGYM